MVSFGRLSSRLVSSNIGDARDFDDTFLDTKPVNNDGNDTDQEQEQTHPQSADGEGSVHGSISTTHAASSAHPPDRTVDVFDRILIPRSPFRNPR